MHLRQKNYNVFAGVFVDNFDKLIVEPFLHKNLKLMMRYVKSVNGTPLSALTTFSESPNPILNAAYDLTYFSAPEDTLKVDADAECARNIKLKNILKRYEVPENIKKSPINCVT